RSENPRPLTCSWRMVRIKWRAGEGAIRPRGDGRWRARRSPRRSATHRLRPRRGAPPARAARRQSRDGGGGFSAWLAYREGSARELMARFKLTIEYDGGPFDGWQRQETPPSVQGALEDAVFAFTGARSDVVGAGRTDSGVHALGQVAHIDIEKPFTASRVR